MGKHDLVNRLGISDACNKVFPEVCRAAVMVDEPTKGDLVWQTL